MIIQLRWILLLITDVMCTLYSEMSCTDRMVCQKNKFRSLKLNNDMTVLLIHDEKFIHSSIQVIIDAGNINNEDGLEIQAHLVEHLFIQQCDVYPQKDTWLKFLVLNTKDFCLKTSPENIHLGITLPNKIWIKAVNWVAAKLSNARFTKEQCESELKILDQEYYFSYHNSTRAIQDLFKMSVHESLPEHKLVDLESDKLDITDLESKTKRFYEKYFTGERIIMVMASNLQLDVLEVYAKQFECIKSGKLETDTKNQQSPITFNDKYQVKSLLQTPIKGEMLKEEFKGALVKFYEIKHKSMFFIRIVLPSLTNYYKYKLLEYFKEVLLGEMRDSFQDNLIEQNLLKTLHLNISEYKRITYLQIIFCLPEPCSDDSVSKILKLFYEWILSHEPIDIVYKYLFGKAFSLYTEPTDASTAACRYIETMRLYRCIDPCHVAISFKYDKFLIEQFFNHLKTINNWTVFVGAVNEQGLNNVLPDGILRYGDPVSIQHIMKNTIPNPKYKNEPKTIPSYINIQDNSDTLLTFLNFLKKTNGKMLIEHKKLSKGEYTIMSSEIEFNRECFVVINFIFESNHMTVFNAEVFFTVLLTKLPEKLKEEHIEIETTISNLNIKGLYIIFEGTLENAVAASKVAGEMIKNLKLNDQEIDLAKKQLTDVYSLSFYENPINIQEELFLCYMKQSRIYNQTELLDITGMLPEEYYLNIRAFGNVDVSKVNKIYENVSSSINKEILLDFKTNILKGAFQYYSYNPKITCKIVMFGYVIDTNYSVLNAKQNSNTDLSLQSAELFSTLRKNLLENYIAGMFLEKILKKALYEYYRYIKCQAYALKVKFLIINYKLFLTFSVTSTLEITDIIRSFYAEFIQKHEEYIRTTEDDYFEDIRCSVLDLIVNYEDVNTYEMGLDLYAELFAQHGNALFDKLQEEANAMTKQKLLKLEIFKQVPIVTAAKGFHNA